jgi:DNA-binding transcriptional LysR family regulator
MIGSFHFGHAIRLSLCFVEIARQCSFSKAADALAVSQPAIARAQRC